MMANYGRYSKSQHSHGSAKSQRLQTSHLLYGTEHNRTPSPSLQPSDSDRRKKTNYATDQKYDTYYSKHENLTSKTGRFDSMDSSSKNITSAGASGFSERQENPNLTRSGVKNELDFSRSVYTKTTPNKVEQESSDPRSNVRKVLDLVSLIRDVDFEKTMQEYRMMKEHTDPGCLVKEDEYHDSTDDLALHRYTRTGDISRVEAERDALKMEVGELHKKITEMTAKFEEESMKHIQKTDAENNEIQKLKKEIEESAERKKTTVEEWKKIIDDYNSKEMNMKAELDTLKSQLDQMNSKIRSVERERDTAQREKTDALTRLSKEMGSKLSDKNPNIADLSDKNRPTRLAEKYNELYDNEWTDALEIFSSLDEEAAIKILLNIIQTAYQFCEKVASEQLQSLQNQIRNPVLKRKETKTPDSFEISNDLVKILAECRKTMGAVFVDELYKEFLAWRSTGKHAMKVEDYSKKCLELCWLMVIQDPPVVLGEPASCGDTMDLNIYKEYTQTGTMVSYTVWLPLILHRKGPMLTKGVAQPISMKLPRRAKTEVDRKTKQTTADRLENRTKSATASTYQENPDSGVSSGMDSQKEVDDLFATNSNRQRGLGDTYTADMHISRRPYGTETRSQYENVFTKQYNAPELINYRNEQYVKYEGNYYTLQHWEDLQRRAVKMSRAGHSDV